MLVDMLTVGQAAAALVVLGALHAGRIPPAEYFLTVSLGTAVAWWFLWNLPRLVPLHWLSLQMKRAPLLVAFVMVPVVGISVVVDFFLPDSLRPRRMLRGRAWNLFRLVTALVAGFGVSLFYFGTPVLRPWLPAMDGQALMFLQAGLALPLCFAGILLLNWQDRREARQLAAPARPSTHPMFVGDVPYYPGLPHMPPSTGPRFSPAARRQEHEVYQEEHQAHTDIIS